MGLINLSGANKGEIAPGSMFSDLYAAAVFGKLTGGFLVKTPKDAAVFFRDGAPVHAGGAAFERHHLGEILVNAAMCSESSIAAALEKQARLPQPRPLLGAILIADGAVDREAIELAMRMQTETRVLSLFALKEGSWISAPGENARIKELGLPIEGKKLLTAGLRSHASDEELRAAADAFLGKSIQLSGSLPELGLDGAERRILRYLDKPRKPDQLERAGKDRRTVRMLLRLLVIFGCVKTLPAAKGIPIPRATLLKGQVPTAAPGESSESAVFGEGEKANGSGGSNPSAPATSAPAQGVASREQLELMKEIRALHRELGNKSHFEILGVTPQMDAAELRKNFTTLQKKFHPDSFAGVLSEEMEVTVSEISARMNEAYQTLSNEESRAAYMALLSDDRIKGDSRKAELIRDAEVKHQMGQVMIRKRDYQKAREYFHFAMESDPGKAEYKAAFAWAMFADPKFDREQALSKGYELLREALKQPRPGASVHYYMGRLLKEKGRIEEALTHFQEALESDPKHADALREVRLLELRANKEESDKSMLSKFFKR